MGEDLERLKQCVPLLEYLRRHHWSGHRVGAGPEFAGLCPLHEDTHPSFYVNAQKNLFYCHGCGCGGDLIRFVELPHHLSFRESVAYLAEEVAPTAQLLPGKPLFPRRYITRSSLGYGRRHTKITTNLRLRQPRRVIVPLSADQVARFWKGFRNFRDLAMVALMLQNGLRSCEVLQLQLEDLLLSEARLHVLGKGRKQRFLPLTADTLQVLENYLHLERPLTNSSALFVSLKGRRRGRPMTAAGLRSLFRHHRLVSKVPQANPHRFRHTFGSDMVRVGISLPALMHLMGHSDIHTTMLYVQLAPEDVWREFARALQQRVRLFPPENMS
jgi:integrase